MRTDTKTLAGAMDVLARDIQSVDGVANAACAEAAERLRELDARLERVSFALRDAIGVFSEKPSLVTAERQEAWIAALAE